MCYSRWHLLLTYLQGVLEWHQDRVLQCRALTDCTSRCAGGHHPTCQYSTCLCPRSLAYCSCFAAALWVLVAALWTVPPHPLNTHRAQGPGRQAAAAPQQRCSSRGCQRPATDCCCSRLLDVLLHIRLLLHQQLPIAARCLCVRARTQAAARLVAAADETAAAALSTRGPHMMPADCPALQMHTVGIYQSRATCRSSLRAPGTCCAAVMLMADHFASKRSRAIHLERSSSTTMLLQTRCLVFVSSTITNFDCSVLQPGQLQPNKQKARSKVQRTPNNHYVLSCQPCAAC